MQIDNQLGICWASEDQIVKHRTPPSPGKDAYDVHDVLYLNTVNMSKNL